MSYRAQVECGIVKITPPARVRAFLTCDDRVRADQGGEFSCSPRPAKLTGRQADCIFGSAPRLGVVPKPMTGPTDPTRPPNLSGGLVLFRPGFTEGHGNHRTVLSWPREGSPGHEIAEGAFGAVSGSLVAVFQEAPGAWQVPRTCTVKCPSQILRCTRARVATGQSLRCTAGTLSRGGPGPSQILRCTGARVARHPCGRPLTHTNVCQEGQDRYLEGV